MRDTPRLPAGILAWTVAVVGLSTAADAPAQETDGAAPLRSSLFACGEECARCAPVHEGDGWHLACPEEPRRIACRRTIPPDLYDDPAVDTRSEIVHVCRDGAAAAAAILVTDAGEEHLYGTLLLPELGVAPQVADLDAVPGSPRELLVIAGDMRALNADLLQVTSTGLRVLWARPALSVYDTALVEEREVRVRPEEPGVLLVVPRAAPDGGTDGAERYRWSAAAGRFVGPTR